MGSNKVLRVALGGDAATEYRTNLAQLAERVRGSTGLFFTKLPREQASCHGRGISARLSLTRGVFWHAAVWRGCAQFWQPMLPRCRCKRSLMALR